MLIYKTKFPLVILVTLMLMACARTKDTEYFLTHPEAIQKQYDECVRSDGYTLKKESSECIALLQAIPIFKSDLTELVNDPNTFGLNIMRAEIKLVQLQQACKQAIKKRDSERMRVLKKAIRLQSLQIQRRFALIRFVSKNK